MVIPFSEIGGQSLLQHLPDIGYFAKNLQGQFIAANACFIEMIGGKTEASLIGKTDFQVWPGFLAEQYVKDDAQVMESGAPLVHKVELVLSRDRSANWFATTKVPLIKMGGEVIGLEGICRYLKKAKVPLEPVMKLPTVMAHIMENYSSKIDIPVLAAMASLSVKQFERKFKQEYGMVPIQYIQRIRLDAARQLLAVTRLPIAKISRETGFYDSSHFSHQFTKYTGLSPKAFRLKHTQAAG
jgi:AraC-like DNA-binding protein